MRNITTALPDLLRMAALADEMELPAPPPPSVSGTGDTAGGSFECAEIDSDLYDSLPTEDEVLAKGVSEIRIEEFAKKLTADGQPYFNIKITIQSEPNIGRVIYDMISWVLPQDIRDANDTSSPRNVEARSILKKRMWKAKAMMAAAGWKAQGKVNFETFLASNPQMKAEHGVEERRSKTDKIDPKTNKPIYEKNGKWQATIKKYLPLV